MLKHINTKRARLGQPQHPVSSSNQWQTPQCSVQFVDKTLLFYFFLIIIIYFLFFFFFSWLQHGVSKSEHIPMQLFALVLKFFWDWQSSPHSRSITQPPSTINPAFLPSPCLYGPSLLLVVELPPTFSHEDPPAALWSHCHSPAPGCSR